MDFLKGLIANDKVKKAFYGLLLAVAVYAGGYFKIELPFGDKEPVPALEAGK
jgi:hypothetical protein